MIRHKAEPVRLGRIARPCVPASVMAIGLGVRERATLCPRGNLLRTPIVFIPYRIPASWPHELEKNNAKILGGYNLLLYPSVFAANLLCSTQQRVGDMGVPVVTT